MLWNTDDSQTLFRSILKKLHLDHREHKYSRYERSWVLKIACRQLLEFCNQTQYQVSPEEQIKLDRNGTISNRLKEFNSYFHRLLPEDQIFLLLKDKHKIPDS